MKFNLRLDAKFKRKFYPTLGLSSVFDRVRTLVNTTPHNETLPLEEPEEETALPDSRSVSLEYLRSKLEQIDYDIVGLLAERARYVAFLAEAKQKAGETTPESKGFKKHLKRLNKRAREENLDPQHLKAVWDVVFEHAKTQEERRLSA